MATLRETLIANNAFKSVESEGFLDLHFYRPGGGLIAFAAMRLRMTPNMLTMISLVTGVAGAILLYWDRWMWTGIGMLAASGLLDASDGQLARMTKTSSVFGRVLDGFADYAVFMATYLALAFKYLYLHPDASPFPIFGLVVLAGVLHSMQSSLFDYYRNEYTDYVDRRKIPVSDFDEIAEPPQGFVQRFLWWCHRDYTNRQRKLARSHVELGEALRCKFGKEKLSDNFAKNYRDLNLPLIWWWNLLGANSRFLVTIAALAVGRPELYFLAEITIYSACAGALHHYQAKADQALLAATV
ncbi:MAG: hypothetical protein COB53_06960 [Elusimicrobia bacterium]|nr:MAG: hypothetical protein COB53_06960 [Elusimicrobiota bacterium]